MIFNQFSFLFLFLPIVLALFRITRFSALRPYVLVAASFVFYGLSGLEHAVVLAVDILWVYWITRSRSMVKNRLLLVAAIAPPFLALFYYKYLGFFVKEVVGCEWMGFGGGQGFEMFTSIILPAGISFFTFQLASFAIDRYRGDVPGMPPLRLFSLYISFFPQLVAGPILRFKNVEKPLNRLITYRPDVEALSRCIGYLGLGLAVKVLIADTLSRCLENYIHQPGDLSVITSVYVVLAYSFQIYFDFYGYSLIAIGLGALFGFKFPDNFVHPYGSLNPRDFWRRWHVTLSFWIRDYLYLPLGGNRSYARNILIVFALCGLWHGAGWTFIVWGLYHGFLVLTYHLTRRCWDRMPGVLQVLMNFALVSIGWTLFVFDFAGLKLFVGSLAGWGSGDASDPSLGMWISVLVAAGVCFSGPLERAAENRPGGLAMDVVRNGILALLFATVLLFLDRSQTFIYFRF